MGSITLAIEVKAPPKKVFDILSSTQGQQSFWTADCDVQPDHARFGFEEAPVDLDVSVHLEPDSLVRMTVLTGFPHWDGSTWEWALSPHGDGDSCTTVIFRHYDFGEGYSEANLGGTAQTWAMTLHHLAQFVETGVPNPYFGVTPR
ncbi:MAG: SRPBCC domain-containing protein [Acidimicrobiales bacterium]|jgi:uncharacterized protein YndB with AHSA1/START domain